jgi:hypothetical protein
LMAEQRTSPRKVLRVKAMLVMDGAAPVAARTFDIGANGLGLTLSEPLVVGKQGQITFEMYFEAKSSVITSRAAVTYCIFSGGDFKAGFQFINLELSAMTVIAKFMR